MMHPSLLIRDVTLVTPTRDRDVRVIMNAHVSISDGIILYVGQDLEAARNVFQSDQSSVSVKTDVQEYSGSNRILLPTFANGHSHIPMSLMKNTADDMSLEDWLFKVILPREEKLVRPDIYGASLLGIAEMINGGIGASADMYFMSEETARAALDSGFRMNICHDGKILENDKWRTDPAGLSDFKKQHHLSGNGLLRVSMMVHSIYLYPEFLYAELSDLARSENVSIQVHLAETKTEVNNCYTRYGMSPAEALEKFGIFDQPCIAAHGVYLTNHDREILFSHHVSVAHNPTSNLKLASGVCDVQSLFKQNVNVCIGTDGSASNNSLDMYYEMKLASLIAKERSSDPEILNARETLYMATRAGYTAMGFPECGIIEPGMSADIQLVRCDNPSVWPVGDPVSALVYGVPASAVETVMIAGRFVKYRGELKTIDFEKVMAETKRSAERIIRA